MASSTTYDIFIVYYLLLYFTKYIMDMYIAICTLQVSGITPIPCTWIISKYKTVPSDQRDALILISAVVRAVVRAVVNVVVRAVEPTGSEPN